MYNCPYTPMMNIVEYGFLLIKNKLRRDNNLNRYKIVLLKMFLN